mmetsp:Transcript_25873/g.64035  ORF Transcript_25873/g.64035 Transcript_25873/m.64035 type:complete len:441 (-) Transcript_25873:1847-3169(-)
MQCCRKWFIASAGFSVSGNHAALFASSRLSTALECASCSFSSACSFSRLAKHRSRSFFRFVAPAFGSASPPMGGTNRSISSICRRIRLISASYRSLGTKMSYSERLQKVKYRVGESICQLSAGKIERTICASASGTPPPFSTSPFSLSFSAARCCASRYVSAGRHTQKATSGSRLYLAHSSPTGGSSSAYSAGVRVCTISAWNCSRVSWQRSYSSPSILRCGVSIEKMHADRCCAMRRKKGTARPWRTSASLRRDEERFVFLAMFITSVTQERSVSPPACASSWSLDRSSSVSIPAILVTRSRSTSSCSDWPLLSVLAMYCSRPTNSIMGYFLYRLPQKLESDCIHNETLRPSSFSRVLSGSERFARMTYESTSKLIGVRYFIISTTGTIRFSYDWICARIVSKTTEGLECVILPRWRPYCFVFSLDSRRIMRFVSSAVL